MNLYTPTRQRLALLDEINDAEGILTPDLEERLRVSDERISEGVAALLALRETAEGQLTGAAATIAQAQAFRAGTQRALDAVNAQLLDAARRFGTLSVGTFRVSILPSKAVVVDDEAAVPRQFQRYVAPVEEQWLPDKTAIGKALKAGEAVPGASLETRENLQVK